MVRYFRQFLFLFCGLGLRWPIWLLIWLIGRTGLLQTLFLIYPTDKTECLDFCPDIPWLRKFLSGRPTPAGLIFNGFKPMGLYLVIPDLALELMRGKNRPIVEQILQRMFWVQKLTGAKTIGLAGQLGPIFEKRHGIPMIPPLYSSMHGNLFSIERAVDHLLQGRGKRPWQVSLAILGGGELGEELQQYLEAAAYRVTMVDVRYTRSGDVKLTDEQEAARRLRDTEVVIHLLPRGKDFMGCRLQELIPASATIVDFSRPPIDPRAIPQTVVMGNRVQRQGLRFFMQLPGGWQQHELPACSMPCLVAAMSGTAITERAQFLAYAQEFSFRTALADVRLVTPNLASSGGFGWFGIAALMRRCSQGLEKIRPAYVPMVNEGSSK